MPVVYLAGGPRSGRTVETPDLGAVILARPGAGLPAASYVAAGRHTPEGVPVFVWAAEPARSWPPWLTLGWCGPVGMEVVSERVGGAWFVQLRCHGHAVTVPFPGPAVPPAAELARRLERASGRLLMANFPRRRRWDGSLCHGV